jgi:hypothetical protein
VASFRRKHKSERGERLWERLEVETGLWREDFKGSKMKWPEIVAEACDSNVLRGEDLEGVWDDVDPGGGGRVGSEEEQEEAWPATGREVSAHQSASVVALQFA